MCRERQFSASGTIPPLRPVRPNRFEQGFKAIPTNDLNVMVEPESVDPSKTKGTHRILYDDSIDAALKIGIGENDRKQILKWLEHGWGKNFKFDQLLTPKTRRIMHKLQVIRLKKEKLANKTRYQ